MFKGFNNGMKILTVSGVGVIMPTIVRAMADGFEKLGADVRHVEAKFAGCRIEEEIRDFAPDFIFTLDYMLNRIKRSRFTRIGVPQVTWFVDDPDYIGIREFDKNDVYFVTDESWKAFLIKKGAENVHYLPLCANPNLTCATCTTGSRFGHDVSFLGSTRDKGKFDEVVKIATKRPEMETVFRRMIDVCVENPGAPFERIIQECFPDWQDFFRSEATYYFKVVMLEEAAIRIRREFVSALGPKVHVYGNEGWLICSDEGVNIHGPLDPVFEAPLLYRDSRVNLNFHTGQLATALNQRMFDVPACGGFVLTDYRADLERLFDFRSEIACFYSKSDMIDKIDYYLVHEDERLSIIEKARKRVLEEHTYESRARKILEVISSR